MANIVSQSPSISEVKAVLAETSNSVGGLCTSSKINKWSKWKPIRKNKVTPLEENDFLPYYGLKLPVYDKIEDLINSIKNLPMPGEDSTYPTWEYLKPTGTAVQPYRLGDFRNYDKTSNIPFVLFSVTPKASIDGGSAIIRGSMGGMLPTETQLGVSDFLNGNRRFAMAYRKGSTGAIKTAIAQPNSSNVSINVVTEGLTTGFYEAYLYFTSDGGSPTTNVVGIEGHPKSYLQFEVIENSVTVNLRAQINELNDNLVDITVTVGNTTENSITLTGAEIQLRSAQSEWIDAMLQYEQRISLGTITAPNGTTTVYNQSISYNKEAFTSWKVFWRNGGLYPNFYAVSILRPLED